MVVGSLCHSPEPGDTAGCWVLSKGWLWKRPRGAAAGALPAPASGPAEPGPRICKYMVDYFYYFHYSLFNSPLFCCYLSKVLQCSGIKGAAGFRFCPCAVTRVGVGPMAPDRAQPDLSRVRGVRIHPTEPWAGGDRAVLCAGGIALTLDWAPAAQEHQRGHHHLHSHAKGCWQQKGRAGTTPGKHKSTGEHLGAPRGEGRQGDEG